MTTLADLIAHFPFQHEFLDTQLRGVRLFRGMEYVPPSPLLHNPGVCIIAQGRKVVRIGERVFQYDCENYLVTSVTIPTTVETFASFQEPLLGIYIEIDLAVLNELIGVVGRRMFISTTDCAAQEKAIGPARMEDDMRDAVFRLVRCLRDECEKKVLGQGLVREILFRVLQGSQGAALYALAGLDTNFSRIADTLRIIQTRYAEKIDVEYLAREAHMGVSAYHRAFKNVTTQSPIQYLKKVRLAKAKELISLSGMKAYIAADQVGYESASQFSREFKRYFGVNPSEMQRVYRVM